MNLPQESGNDFRAQLEAVIHHLEHVLPGQGPIKDFVHHNTLHGYQHLHFTEALKKAEEVSGTRGYQPLEQFREYFQKGRITEADLRGVLADGQELGADEELARWQGRVLCKHELLLTALIHPIEALAPCQLNWQIEELDALSCFQADVDKTSRAALLEAGAHSEPAVVINELWSACLQTLGLEHFIQHPEELVDLSPVEAEKMLSRLLDEEGDTQELPQVHVLMRTEAAQLLDRQLEDVGESYTLRGLLLRLTGTDILDDVRPYLIRHLGSYLDQGLAAWHNPARAKGFYQAWRESAARDTTWLFHELPDWQDTLDTLPDDPMAAIIAELHRMGLPQPRWGAYLERLALELPGWSGMFYWRHSHPDYQGMSEFPVRMTDYLAVRVVLEGLIARRLCRDHWQVDANLDLLRWYFRRRRSELLVRYYLYNKRLPEYLAGQAQRLVERSPLPTEQYEQWQHLADMVWTWQQSSEGSGGGYTVFDKGWRLFRLAQHLGLAGAQISALETAQVEAIFATLDRLDSDTAAYLWLQAYERHYRDEIFHALRANHRRGRWAERSQRPTAQVVFCMDDREEGMRRHLEELAPDIETLGAAAHFGVPNFWRGLDDQELTGLTPVVLVPSHEIHEQAQPGQEAHAEHHRRRRAWRLRAKRRLFEHTRRDPFSGALMMLLAAPATLLVLTAKVLAPLGSGRLIEALRRCFDREGVVTDIALTAAEAKPGLSPDNRQLGFTDSEQFERVEAFLQNIGLLSGFAPLTVIMGHGSISQNNPHLAAYDCGACSGRHSGPNARIFAAMANRPAVRARLRARGIDIPDDTWFIGAEHNTCDEALTWYDADKVPAQLDEAFARLKDVLYQATLGSAHERARRFASAPQAPSPQQALAHIVGRSLDFSQARPELGHATNAVAVIGRRSVSQGAFFDRRMFLISYDPNTDPEGRVLERLLLANGPVGAGINLEYYFSTVNNEQYGCGTKVMHNVTGLFGVMDGAGSDLRTGLPRQMIEIHEAMRLQVVVESTLEQVATIYQRQPPLQELIGNGWLLVSVIHPESGEISVFEPSKGFIPWRDDAAPLPEVERSAHWYAGHDGPLPPVLIKQEVARG